MQLPYGSNQGAKLNMVLNILLNLFLGIEILIFEPLQMLLQFSIVIFISPADIKPLRTRRGEGNGSRHGNA